jgi:uncharacterized protein (TIGR03643 family)
MRDTEEQLTQEQYTEERNFEKGHLSLDKLSNGHLSKEPSSKDYPSELYPLERHTEGHLTEVEQSRVIEMAWEDRTPFEAIEDLYGLPEKEVINLMRQNLKHKTFKNWRARVSGRKTKHKTLRPAGVERGYCPSQYKPQSANK